MKKIFKWKYSPEGNCPVQAEGYFLGTYFYFRSRWDYAQIDFAKSEDDWQNYKNRASYVLYKTYGYEAGHFEKWFCKLLIYKGCLLYFFKINIIKNYE
jgi:hypothetical protein